MTLAALLVVGMGLAVAAWGLHSGDKQSVVAVAGPVAKGQVIERGDLVSVSVSGVPGAIPVADVDVVVGTTAAVDLVAGQILTGQMTTTDPVPGAGQSVVGMALDASRVPGAGFAAGEVVDVIAVPGGDTGGGGDAGSSGSLDAPVVLARAASVYAVQGGSTAGGQVVVTLVIDASDANRVAAYATQNRVALVETSLAPATSGTSGGR